MKNSNIIVTAGDGSIDVDEFTSVCSTYGVSPDECRGAYKKLSKVTLLFLIKMGHL